MIGKLDLLLRTQTHCLPHHDSYHNSRTAAAAAAADRSNEPRSYFQRDKETKQRTAPDTQTVYYCCKYMPLRCPLTTYMSMYEDQTIMCCSSFPCVSYNEQRSPPGGKWNARVVTCIMHHASFAARWRAIRIIHCRQHQQRQQQQQQFL